MTDKDNIINQIRQTANDSHPDAEIYLYGSQARGDSDKNSDWDILILLNQNKITFEIETQIMDKYYDLELATGVVISPLIYSKKEWNTKYVSIPLHKNIDKDGVRIK